MNHSTLLQNILKQNEISFDYQGMFFSGRITIVLPQLVENEYTVWGDWGPMYSFKLRAEQVVRLECKDSHSNRVTCHSLTPETIQLLSPIEAKRRKEMPLYIALSWPERGCVIHLYCDNVGRYKYTEIIRLDKDVIHVTLAA